MFLEELCCLVWDWKHCHAHLVTGLKNILNKTKCHLLKCAWYCKKECKVEGEWKIWQQFNSPVKLIPYMKSWKGRSWVLKNTDKNKRSKQKDGLRREDPVSIYHRAITLIAHCQLPGYRPTRHFQRFRHAGAAVLWGSDGMELPHEQSKHRWWSDQ